MKQYIFLLLFFVFCGWQSCKPPEYKICNCKSADEQLEIYSQVLNELVERHFGSFYLGPAEDTIFKMKFNREDSATISRKEIQLQNEIFNNPGRYCLLVLDTTFMPAFNSWEIMSTSRNAYDSVFCQLFRGFSSDGQSIVDSLNSVQNRYMVEDYILCTARLVSWNKIDTSGKHCYIGRVALSKLYLDRLHTRGLMYYQYRCGGLCGHTGIVIFEKKDGLWKIARTEIMSVS